MNTDFKKGSRLDLPDSDIIYYPKFFSKPKVDSYFKNLLTGTAWQQDDIKIFGKVYAQPRLTALYASNDKQYSYSNIIMKPHLFTDMLLDIKSELEKYHPHGFTTCLLNFYRNGRDSNGWHADNEKELGKNPVIASISLGAERMFHLKHNKNPDLKHKMILEHGSLLIMQGETQHMWKHQIPKTAKQVGERINLTFRVIN